MFNINVPKTLRYHRDWSRYIGNVLGASCFCLLSIIFVLYVLPSRVGFHVGHSYLNELWPFGCSHRAILPLGYMLSSINNHTLMDHMPVFKKPWGAYWWQTLLKKYSFISWIFKPCHLWNKFSFDSWIIKKWNIQIVHCDLKPTQFRFVLNMSGIEAGKIDRWHGC